MTYSNIGRIFYGVSVAVIGSTTVAFVEFPYMLVPDPGSWNRIIVFVSGVLLAIGGACIVFKKQTLNASLVIAGLLSAVFILVYVPYQFMYTDFTRLADWENAIKELDLACGALIVASFFSERKKLFVVGSVLFAVTMISYGILHFQVGKDAADYVPSWIPARVFWVYAGGVGLLASGIAILLKIKTELAAVLLGSMIFTWFAILHVPRVVLSPVADLNSEITSAMLALSYSGIAFMIASNSFNNRRKTS